MTLVGQLLIAVVITPFIVSGAFWISPWIGVPALVVALPMWLGWLLSIGEAEAKKKAGAIAERPEMVSGRIRRPWCWRCWSHGADNR